MTQVPPAENSPQLSSETRPPPPEVSASCHPLPSRCGRKGGFQPNSSAQREAERTKARRPQTPPAPTAVPRRGCGSPGGEAPAEGQSGGRSLTCPLAGPQGPGPDPDLVLLTPAEAKASREKDAPGHAASQSGLRLHLASRRPALRRGIVSRQKGLWLGPG